MSDDSIINSTLPTSEGQGILRTILDILRPFRSIATLAGGDAYLTLHKVPAMICSLRDHAERLNSVGLVGNIRTIILDQVCCSGCWTKYVGLHALFGRSRVVWTELGELLSLVADPLHTLWLQPFIQRRVNCLG